MADAHCKIGRIRPKSGGEVRLLPDPRVAEGEALHKDLAAYVSHVREQFSPSEFAGYAIVTWGRDLNHCIYHNHAPGSPISNTQLPTFVGDCFRRRLARKDAHTAIDERLVE